MSFARVAGRAARVQSLVHTSQPQRVLTPAAAVQRGAFALPTVAPIRYLAPGPSFSGGMPYVVVVGGRCLRRVIVSMRLRMVTDRLLPCLRP